MTISLPFKKGAVKRVPSLSASSPSLNTFCKEGCNFAPWKLWLVLPLGRVEWQPIWGDIKKTAAADVSQTVIRFSCLEDGGAQGVFCFKC